MHNNLQDTHSHTSNTVYLPNKMAPMCPSSCQVAKLTDQNQLNQHKKKCVMWEKLILQACFCNKCTDTHHVYKSISWHRTEKQATDNERYALTWICLFSLQFLQCSWRHSMAEKLNNWWGAVISLFRVCNIFIAHPRKVMIIYLHTHTHTQDSIKPHILLNILLPNDYV